MTALATVDHGSELAIRDDQSTFTDKQLAALRQIGVAGASNADVAIFFHHCVRTGLDPFARQIYMIERQGKQTIQTGIDGFRLIARRACDSHGEALGYADTLWCGDDGQWTDVWLKREHPRAAKVTVLRNGQPFPAVALWDEYVAVKRDGSTTKMWAEKGVLMLAKCAEALALRKAFPQDLSGLYTSDEMQQADNQPGRTAAPRQAQANRRAATAEAARHEPTAGPLADEPVDADVVEEPPPPGDVEPDFSALDAERFEQLVDGATTASELNAIAADIAASSIQGEAREQLRRKFSTRVRELAPA